MMVFDKFVDIDEYDLLKRKKVFIIYGYSLFYVSKHYWTDSNTCIENFNTYEFLSWWWVTWFDNRSCIKIYLYIDTYLERGTVRIFQPNFLHILIETIHESINLDCRRESVLSCFVYWIKSFAFYGSTYIMSYYKQHSN